MLTSSPATFHDAAGMVLRDSHEVSLLFHSILHAANLRTARYYLATSRQLKRLEAASRSPIFAWFSETLDGLSTIRSFGQQNIFIEGLQHRLDMNQACYLLRSE